MERSRLRRLTTNVGIFCLLAVASFVLVRCGGSSSTMAGMGSANVTISDPPSCTDQFQHVYVAITGVMAHTSASAAPNDAGWQNLTSQLSLNSPVQLDLLNLSGGGAVLCLLKQLGSDQSLPEGSYQQIRLLLANNGSGAPTVTNNPCTTTGGLPSGTVNCVEDSSNNWKPLELSSQDQTGLKIPPGQIMGGPINVAAGKTVDININFNTCSSLAPDQSNNSYRLKPTLTASQVSPNTSGISGTIVSGAVVAGPPLGVTAGSAVAGATVNLELPGAGAMDTTNNVNTDGVFDTAVSDSNGNFFFCPLNVETGGIDVVADAPAPTSGTPPSTAGATIVEGVPNGAKLSSVPIILQGGLTNTPGTLTVTPTATEAAGTSTTPAFTVDLDLLPLQLTSSSSGYEFIVPALNGSTGTSMVVSCPGGASGNCTITSPASGSASILVPAAAPLVGSYNASGGTIAWNSAPSFVTTSASTGSYVVEANGSVGNNPAHTCTTQFTSPNTVTAGQSKAVNVSLSNCK